MVKNLPEPFYLEVRNPCIVLAPCWPGFSSGYEIAVYSSLLDLLRSHGHVHMIVICEREKDLPGDLKNLVEDGRLSFSKIRIRTQAKSVRFAKSVFTNVPAVCQQFNTAGVRDRVRKLFSRFVELVHDDVSLVVEDLPLAQVLLSMPIPPGVKCTRLRSHNVLADCFIGFESDGVLSRFLWRHENRRIRRFEEHALRQFDEVWAISEDDRERYRVLYGVDASVLPIRVPACFFGDFPDVGRSSVCHELISIGTLDLRKQHGMQWFIDNVFAPLHQRHKQLTLTLIGRHTEKFKGLHEAVFCKGFVDDISQEICPGQIFVNPQFRGSGVNLKSLFAMGSGFCLVCTPMGIQGIEAAHGVHCVVTPVAGQMQREIESLVFDSSRRVKLARAGQVFVRNNYCRLDSFESPRSDDV